MGAFAAAFVRGRLVGFEKDMKICLTPVPRADGTGKTYAYFPALAACTSTLEYLTALDRGDTRGIGWTQVADFAAGYGHNRTLIGIPFAFCSKRCDIR
jgi:hypothetical protein